MNQRELYGIASTLSTSRPDRLTGTVGENRLWHRIVKAFTDGTVPLVVDGNRRRFRDTAEGIVDANNIRLTAEAQRIDTNEEDEESPECGCEGCVRRRSDANIL